MPSLSLHAALLVFFGGGIGACMRYALSQVQFPWSTSWPVATFLINIVGSFLIGYAAYHLPIEKMAWARPLLMTGVLGGFTTFSAFSLEGLIMLQAGRVFEAFAYILSSVGIGLIACYVGSII